VPQDFQFDSTMDGKAVKIASLIDEHTRLSVLNIVDRSITAEKVDRGARQDVRRMGWPTPGTAARQRSRVHIESAATVLRHRDRNRLHPAGDPVEQRHIESFNNRLRKECLNRNHWTSLLEARVIIADFKDDHNHRHRHSSLGYLTPAEYAARCTHTHHPVAREID